MFVLFYKFHCFFFSRIAPFQNPTLERFMRYIMDDDTGTVKILLYSNQFENLDAWLFHEPKFM